MPGTAHGTVDPWDEDPASLSYGSGLQGLRAVLHQAAGDVDPDSATPGAEIFSKCRSTSVPPVWWWRVRGARVTASTPPSTDGSTGRNVPGCGCTVCRVTQLAALFSLVGASHNGVLG